MRYNYYNTIYSIITHILLGFFLLEKLGPDAWNSVRVLYTWNGHLLVLFTTKQPYTDQGGCRKSHRRSFVITVFCSLTILSGIIHLQTTGSFFIMRDVYWNHYVYQSVFLFNYPVRFRPIMLNTRDQ